MDRFNIRDSASILTVLRERYREKPILSLGDIWEGHNYYFRRGQLISLTGHAKSGKTALVHNIFTRTPNASILNCHFEMQFELEAEEISLNKVGR